MIVGMGAGAALGAIFGNVGLGAGLGFAVGMGVGALLDIPARRYQAAHPETEPLPDSENESGDDPSAS